MRMVQAKHFGDKYRREIYLNRSITLKSFITVSAQTSMSASSETISVGYKPILMQTRTIGFPVHIKFRHFPPLFSVSGDRLTTNPNNRDQETGKSI